MTRASQTKQTRILYWDRGGALVIYQRAGDWDPGDPDDLQYALNMIDRDVPLEGWISLAREFLTNLES